MYNKILKVVTFSKKKILCAEFDILQHYYSGNTELLFFINKKYIFALKFWTIKFYDYNIFLMYSCSRNDVNLLLIYTKMCFEIIFNVPFLLFSKRLFRNVRFNVFETIKLHFFYKRRIIICNLWYLIITDFSFLKMISRKIVGSKSG